MREHIATVTEYGRGQRQVYLTDERIVRCRDCRMYARDELGCYCSLLDFEDTRSMDDRYCAWGEAK